LNQLKKGEFMIQASIVFFGIAILAYVLGAYSIAGISMGAGKILLFVFLALSVLSILVSPITGRKRSQIP
jgi:uncharacterized membrane protein YtjA (UPF0391 family)